MTITQWSWSADRDRQDQLLHGERGRNAPGIEGGPHRAAHAEIGEGRRHLKLLAASCRGSDGRSIDRPPQKLRG